MNRRDAARLIDADKTRMEALGLFGVRGVVRRALEASVAALRSQEDPGRAAERVIRTLAPVIRDGMVAAHLQATRRTQIIAAPAFRARRKLKLAGTVYDDALDFLRRRLELGEQQVQQLTLQYNAPALDASNRMGEDVRKRIEAGVAEAVRGGSGRAGVDAIRQSFADAGLTSVEDYRVEQVFRTQTQIAYNAGRWTSLQDEAVQEILWGYEYIATQDERTRQTHAAMDGYRAPKGDPVWGRWWPPCGYNCRCSTLEIFTDDAEARATGRVPKIGGVEVTPDKGFDFNPGRVYVGLPRL